MSIAQEEPESSGRKIVLMILLNGVADECDTCPVLCTVPPRAVGGDALIEGLLDLGVGEGFGFAVVPAEAGESGEIAREILLQIQAESIFARDMPGMSGDVGSLPGLGGLDDLIAIEAHVGGVGVGENADHS